MQITEVRVFPAGKADEKLKAFATVTFDHCFVVRDLKVINGNKGLFIAMPSRKRSDGSYVDIPWIRRHGATSSRSSSVNSKRQA